MHGIKPSDDRALYAGDLENVGGGSYKFVVPRMQAESCRNGPEMKIKTPISLSCTCACCLVPFVATVVPQFTGLSDDCDDPCWVLSFHNGLPG